MLEVTESVAVNDCGLRLQGCVNEPWPLVSVALAGNTA